MRTAFMLSMVGLLEAVMTAFHGGIWILFFMWLQPIDAASAELTETG
jgi:hypothetical protein